MNPTSIKISCGSDLSATLDDVLRGNLPASFQQRLAVNGVRFDRCGNVLEGHEFVIAFWKILVSSTGTELFDIHDKHYKLKQEKSTLDSKISQMQLQLTQSEAKLKNFATQDQILQQANRDISELKKALSIAKQSETVIKLENQQLKNECEQLKSENDELKNKLEKQKEDHALQMQQKENEKLFIANKFQALEAKLDTLLAMGLGSTPNSMESTPNSTTGSLEED